MAEINLQAQRRYLEEKVNAASALGRIVILYEACLRFMNEAKSAFQVKNKLVACEKIIRAQNIIRELRNALNLDLEPKISGNMYRLYSYFLKRLMEANRYRSADPIDYVIKQMTILNNAWKEADSQGLGKGIKRYEERLGMSDVNILRRYEATAKSGEVLVETLR